MKVGPTSNLYPFFMMAAFLPPTLSSFSKSVTLNPLLAKSMAAVRPPGPAPTTFIFLMLDNVF